MTEPPPETNLTAKSVEVDLTAKPDAEQFDLTEKLGPDKPLQLGVVDSHSVTWASIMKPFGYIIFGLVTLVIVMPFFFAAWQPEVESEKIIGWANTVFPPVVGFASAVVGYLFGTRNPQKQSESNED